MDHSLDQEIVPDSGHAGSPLAHAPLTAVADGNAFPAGPTASGPADPRARVYWIWAVCGFLLLAVGLVFGQTVRHDFVGYDDNIYVYKNPHVTPGLTLSGVWWALTDGPFGDWYPLTCFSHMLDCQLYGLNPGGHYLTNVLLHAASSVLLFLALLRMTGDFWPSAWVAAVFAIHPLHVESVAWLAERRDMLSGLFFMLTLLAYAWYVERPSLARCLAVAGCLALGLMSKPMLVTVPFLLLLLDYWPLGRFRRAAGAGPRAESGSWLGRLPVFWRLVVEKIPLMVLAAGDAGIVVLTHASLRATGQVDQLSLATRLANALVSYAAYLGQSFYPARLAPFYPHLGDRLPVAWTAGSLVLLVAITAVAVYGWRRWPYLLVGWLWFLVALVPVIGLVHFGAHARADRYTYLSQIGLSIALAWGVWTIYQWRQSLQAARWRGWLLAVVSGGVVLLLAAVAGRQTAYWLNTETLWTHALACTERNAMAHCLLASFYARQGRTEEAIDHLREAVEADSIDPLLIAECHDLFADQLTKQGKIDEALSHYEQAVRVVPTDVTHRAHLAVALAGAGRPDRAVAEWHAILRLSPTALEARLGLADALLAQGEAGQAVAQCSEILKHEPGATEAIVTLGAALAAEGQIEEAFPYLTRALELQPGNARARFHLGLALYRRGQAPSAITQLNAAIQLQPDNVPMLWQTAWLLATSPDSSIRDGSRAVGLAGSAIQLSHGQEPRAIDTLAAALAETGEFSAAVDAAEQASTIALAHGDAALADAIAQRTRLYRQGSPYRESAASLPAGHARPKAAE